MKRIVARAFAPLALIVGLIVTPVSAARAADLGVDVATACHMQYGPTATAIMISPGNAYSWRCRVPIGSSLYANYSVDIANYCRYFYGPSARAVVLAPSSAYSW